MLKQNFIEIVINVNTVNPEEAYAVITEQNISILSQPTTATIKQGKVYVKFSNLINSVLNKELVDLVEYDDLVDEYTVWTSKRRITFDDINNMSTLFSNGYTAYIIESDFSTGSLHIVFKGNSK